MWDCVCMIGCEKRLSCREFRLGLDDIRELGDRTMDG